MKNKPFDGELLPQEITVCIMQIPQTIRTTEHLLDTPSPNVSSALQVIVQLREQLMKFHHVGLWLLEAKKMHEALQNLANGMHPIQDEFAKAWVKGMFDYRKYNLMAVRTKWTESEYFTHRILTVAQQLRVIEKSPLILDSENKYVSGPEWARRIVVMSGKIRDLFHRIDRGERSGEIILELAECINQMDSQVRQLMGFADERIRRESETLGSTLEQMVGRVARVD